MGLNLRQHQYWIHCIVTDVNLFPIVDLNPGYPVTEMFEAFWIFEDPMERMLQKTTGDLLFV